MLIKKCSWILIAILVFTETSVCVARDNLLDSVTNSSKVIAISFDDGPNNGSTLRILDELEKRNIKATFFVLGRAALANKATLARMDSYGSEVANHSYSHPDLTKNDVPRIWWQIKLTSEIIFSATGRVPALMRPPGGAVNQEVIRAAKQLGLETVIWSLDPKDWKYRNARYIIDYVLENAMSGDVVLLHDTHVTTANAVPEILDGLISAGFTFVTVSEMLAINKNLALGNGIPWYRKAKGTFPGIGEIRMNTKVSRVGIP